jgi:hypothetical protein
VGLSVNKAGVVVFAQRQLGVVVCAKVAGVVMWSTALRAERHLHEGGACVLDCVTVAGVEVWLCVKEQQEQRVLRDS